MEKWKIGIIVVLLAGFGGFAATQNKPPIANPETSDHTDDDGHDHSAEKATALPTPDPKVMPLIGKTPPTWNIPANLWMNTRKPLTPADLKGKVTLLEFFRTGCSHCADAVPFIEAMQGQYGPRGLQVIALQSPGVLTDPSNPELNWKSVQGWLKERAVTYPAAFDTGRAIKDKTGITTYPLSLVIGKDGKIIYGQTGHTQEKAASLAAAVEKALTGK